MRPLHVQIESSGLTKEEWEERLESIRTEIANYNDGATIFTTTDIRITWDNGNIVCPTARNQ